MIEVKEKCKLEEATGQILCDEPFYMASVRLYHAFPGDKVTVNDWAFLLQVAIYSTDIPEEYMYTYCYQDEQNWATFEKVSDEFTTDAYTFEKECFFRICIKKSDGNWCIKEDADRINEIVSFHSLQNDDSVPNYFADEIKKTVDTVLTKTSEGKSLVFGLLADSHYVANGTWDETVGNLAEVNKRVGFDGIIHLGDLHDGLLDKKTNAMIASECLGDLRQIVEPVYLTVGNHDTNYFKGNPDWMTEEEQYAVYGRYNDRYVHREGMSGWYYVDYEHMNLRMIFLSSFNHKEQIRYGFPLEEVRWVERTLEATPEGYSVLVFSHDAPLERLDYWAKDIRNGEELVRVLEEFNEKPYHKILGYIHGHTHADYVFEERSFPIISVGCSKVEYFSDKKPEGSVRQMRKLKDVTQDLWDVLIITPEKAKLEFVRFGAGEDRTVRPKMQVWGHRGASGYAPENTLEAFKLAADMGADGVELDVQLTKDGEVVVAHDERIDRVSDHEGFIEDYTLAELKEFNFNKTHPEYCDMCKIPTLREVLELLKDTGMVINIELKTGVRYYDGIEEKVNELVKSVGGYENRIIYSSFNHKSVMKMKNIAQNARFAFLHTDQLSGSAAYAKANGVGAMHPSTRYVFKYKSEIQECIKNGVEVNVWTVNSEEAFKELRDMGINAAITNYPDICLGR